MSKFMLAVVLAVVMGFGAMSFDSSDVTSEVFPRCDWWGGCGSDPY